MIPPSKKRVEYIDLAKGICIILVVMMHCSVCTSEYITYLRMPFYFTISGLFFKDYGGGIFLLIKKINKLIIPFIFFYLFEWIIYWVFHLLRPGFWNYNGSFFGDLWTGNYINGPMWFLLCLFWCNIIYFFISKYLDKICVAVMVLAIAVLGIILIKSRVFCPAHILSSFAALPLFFFGQKLRTSKIILSERSWKQVVFSVFLFLVVYVIYKLPAYGLGFLNTNICLKVLLYYVKSMLMVIAALLLCKYLNKLPIVSYCGRYSIIILGVHAGYIYVGYYLPNLLGSLGYDKWVQFIFVFLLCVISIPILKYLFPYFTAQKDIFVIKDSKEQR